MQIIQEKWWLSTENLRQLASFIQDRDGGYDSLDTAYFLEKPWKWEEDWNEYQISIHIDDDLDAFDRRDK